MLNVFWSFVKVVPDVQGPGFRKGLSLDLDLKLRLLSLIQTKSVV